MRPGVEEAEQGADRGSVCKVRWERRRKAEQGGVPAVDGSKEIIFPPPLTILTFTSPLLYYSILTL